MYITFCWFVDVGFGARGFGRWGEWLDGRSEGGCRG